MQGAFGCRPVSTSARAALFMIWLVAGCGGGDDTPSQGTGPSSGGQNGGGGSTSAQLGRFNGPVTAVMFVPDGNGDLFVAGTFTTYEGRPVRPVVRLRPNGTINEGFTLAGTILSAPGSTGRVTSLATADDGTADLYISEVDGGEISRGGPIIGRIWKVNSDGTVDAAFLSGEVVTDMSAESFATTIHTLVPVGDGSGRVYVGGSFNRYNGGPASALLRLLPNGVIDPSFRSQGGGALRIAPAKDGTRDLYVVSYRAVDLLEFGSPDLHRIHADGTRDEAFATVTVLGSPDVGSIRCLEVLADGSGDVLIGGTFFIDPMGSGPRFLDPTAMRNVARVNPDGTRDHGSPRPRVEDQVVAIATAVDGTNDWLLAAGTPPTMMLQRFHADGQRDTTFGPVSIVGWVQHLLPIPDDSGDFYMGGDITSYNGVSVGPLVRVRGDGQLR